MISLNRKSDRTDQGATAIEYALICTLIAVFIAGSAAFFGQQLNALFVIIGASF